MTYTQYTLETRIVCQRKVGTSPVLTHIGPHFPVRIEVVIVSVTQRFTAHQTHLRPFTVVIVSVTQRFAAHQTCPRQRHSTVCCTSDFRTSKAMSIYETHVNCHCSTKVPLPLFGNELPIKEFKTTIGQIEKCSIAKRNHN